MLKRDVYKQINRLCKESSTLRSSAIDKNTAFDTSVEMRKQQDIIYKKFQFYKNFVRAAEKLECKKVL